MDKKKLVEQIARKASGKVDMGLGGAFDSLKEAVSPITEPIGEVLETLNKPKKMLLDAVVPALTKATDLTPASMKELKAKNIAENAQAINVFADVVTPDVTDFIPVAKAGKFAHVLGMGAMTAKDILKNAKTAEEAAAAMVKLRQEKALAERVAQMEQQAAKAMEVPQVAAKAPTLDPNTLERPVAMAQGKQGLWGSTPEEKAKYVEQLRAVDRQNMLNKAKRIP